MYKYDQNLFDGLARDCDAHHDHTDTARILGGALMSELGQFSTALAATLRRKEILPTRFGSYESDRLPRGWIVAAAGTSWFGDRPSQSSLQNRLLVVDEGGLLIAGMPTGRSHSQLMDCILGNNHMPNAVTVHRFGRATIEDICQPQKSLITDDGQVEEWFDDIRLHALQTVKKFYLT